MVAHGRGCGDTLNPSAEGVKAAQLRFVSYSHFAVRRPTAYACHHTTLRVLGGIAEVHRAEESIHSSLPQ